MIRTNKCENKIAHGQFLARETRFVHHNGILTNPALQTGCANALSAAECPTEKIISAQKARGADFDSGNLIQRAKAMIPILVPLFISAFRRADELATAMECRLYRGDVGRTRMRQLKIARVDICALLWVAALFMVIIALKHFGL